MRRRPPGRLNVEFDHVPPVELAGASKPSTKRVEQQTGSQGCLAREGRLPGRRGSSPAMLRPASCAVGPLTE